MAIFNSYVKLPEGNIRPLRIAGSTALSAHRRRAGRAFSRSGWKPCAVVKKIVGDTTGKNGNPNKKPSRNQAASCHTHIPCKRLGETCRDDRDYQIVSQREHAMWMNGNLRAFRHTVGIWHVRSWAVNVRWLRGLTMLDSKKPLFAQ